MPRSARQLALPFESPPPPPGSVLRSDPIAARHATFKAGLLEQFHRWFRLTPSFAPDLVDQMLSTMGANSSDIVLDPFCGAATTVIQARLNGIRSAGIEINPFLHFVGSTCLEWNLPAVRLRSELSSLHSAFRDQRTVSQAALPPPPIHDPFRWWRPDVLQDLLVLRSLIGHLEAPDQHRQFFRLALAGVLVPDLTNVTLGRLQLHFIDRSDHRIDVWGSFSKHAEMMIADLENVATLGAPPSAFIVHADSTRPETYDSLPPVDCVITSPPYPNRYSYVWNTRPHLYFFEFLGDARQASDLDKATLGGTWGTATSVLAKGVLPFSCAATAKVVDPVASEIRRVDNLMANYLVKYFNLLAQQLRAMTPHLASGGRLAYVVGCSRLKDVFVETDTLLASVLENLGLGYTVTDIHRFRKRHSGKDLHESIVYARKS